MDENKLNISEETLSKLSIDELVDLKVRIEVLLNKIKRISKQDN